MYEGLAASCGSVGKRILAAQRSDIARLFARACASDEQERGGLPERCDRGWFTRAFCSAGDQEPLPVRADTPQLFAPLVSD
jgi:hypothetical protein